MSSTIQGLPQCQMPVNVVIPDEQEKQVALKASTLEKTPEKDTVELENKEEPKASTAKKIGVGVASGFIPGLGQFINGQWLKGLAFLAGNIGSNYISSKPLVQLAVSLPINIMAIIDAVKNAKPSKD